MFPKVPWRIESDGLTVVDADGNRVAHAGNQTVASFIASIPALLKWFWNRFQRDYARMEAHRAMRDGRLKRVPCEVCGAEPTEFHHPNYAKPLEGKFLGLRHHQEATGK
jgi:hypothetical protein